MIRQRRGLQYSLLSPETDVHLIFSEDTLQTYHFNGTEIQKVTFKIRWMNYASRLLQNIQIMISQTVVNCDYIQMFWKRNGKWKDKYLPLLYGGQQSQFH